MRWFETPDFNFLKAHKIGYAVSGILLFAAIIGILTKGLQYGIDFKGGKEFVLEFEQPVEVVELRSALTEPLGSTPTIKLFGSPSEVLIRTDNPGDITEVQASIVNAVEQLYPQNKANVVKTDIVGARFAEDLKRGALNAIIFALIVIFIYILIRFKDWTYSAGAVAALFHDVLIIVGVFTFFSEIVPFSMQIDE
jgi:preprotein translocase SecF subunit